MPPGTSKWNKIEHRLFSHISMNWAGQPLTSHQVAVSLIAGTATRTGLTVRAERDTSTYPRGIKIPDRDMKTLTAQHLTPHDWHGEWNYTGTGPRTQLSVLFISSGYGEFQARVKARRFTPLAVQDLAHGIGELVLCGWVWRRVRECLI